MQNYEVTLQDTVSGSAQGPFTLNGSVSSATIRVTQPLISGHKYLTNITGRNGVGLSSSLLSDGFVVDTTPVNCSNVWNGDGDLRSEIRYIPVTTRLTLSWRCYDNESPIKTFRFAVKDSGTGAFILPFHTLKAKINATGTAIVTGNGKWLPKYQEGHSYTIGIELVNAVNLKSIFWTNVVTVDSSPPAFKNLKLKFNPTADLLTGTWNLEDKESGLKSLKWGLGRTPLLADVYNFTSLATAAKGLKITNSMVSLQLGRTYFMILKAMNKAGLSSRAVSNGVVIDRTKPNAGIVTAQYVLPPNYDRNSNVVPYTSFTVAWTGFIDQESGVAQFSWAVGTNMQTTKTLESQYFTKVSADDSVGGVVISNFTVTGNVTYFACIRATNGAGLERTDCSIGVTVILGKFSAGIVKDGPSKLRKDSDFQLDNRAIWVHWDGFKDPVYGIASYEWCIGDKQPTPSQKNICKWPYMKLTRVVNKANRFYNLTLAHGTTYYATVKAKNSRGESVTASSDGVLVDRSPPVGGSIKVAPTVGTDTLFMTTLAAPTVTWEMEDKESGISHFEIGVGSFPMQDDLLSFTRVNDLERSVDLDDFNFTTSQGQSFYVTLTGYNMLGLKTSLTSQQVIVDVTPPEAGEVLDGSGNDDVDYQTDENSIAAHWYGFKDEESDVVEYQWCVGTTQGGCDVLGLTTVELQTSVSANVRLENGTRYYVTVISENAAGLKQTAFSDGISVDNSPPVTGSINLDAPYKMGSKYMQSNGRKLVVSWDKIEDEESDITALSWCAGNSSGSCEIVEFTSIDVHAASLEHSFERPLDSGTSVFVTVRATNGAGGSSQVTSSELLIDTTKPSVGGVSVGNSIDKKYLKKDEALKADWGGFEDLETGIDHYDFALCIASSSDRCITPFMNVGLETSIDNDGLDLKPGICYVIVVRAYNKVNLYSERQSNLFTLEDESPVPGAVFDGSKTGRDISMQSSTTTVMANWEPFTDRNSRISKYEICVGDSPSLCSVAPFQIVTSILHGAITGLNLQHKNTYYITIKATNEAGYSSMASSDGVIIDSTPPVGGRVRDGLLPDDIDLQPYDSFISANWDEFSDPESGIEKYIWCAGTIKGSCDVIGETVTRDAKKVSLQVSPPLSSGIRVYVTVSGVNGVGEKTTVHSNGVQIDDTPPVISKVSDLQTNRSLNDIDYLTSKTEYCASWDVNDDESGLLKSEVSVCSTLDSHDCLVKWSDVGNRTLICMSSLELVEGLQYTTTVRVTNNVGLSATKSSNSFMVDSTPPIIGEIEHTENIPDSREASPQRYTSSDVSVQWHGFWDKESAVEKYYICLGTKQERCVTNYTMVQGSTAYAFKGLSLKHNTMYFVSIIAENSAGLKSNPIASDGVLMDTTAPEPGSIIYDGSTEEKDIDYQQSDRDIKANWKRFDDPESDVIKVTWCAGSKSISCDIIQSTELLPWVTSVHEVLDAPMTNGQQYYVTVRATNGAGEVRTVTSNGVTIDTTPPITGIVLDGNNRIDIDYIGEEVITGHWRNFTDEESSIGFYEVAICEAKNLSSCPQPYAVVNKATNVSISGLDLDSGTLYIIKVRATNMAGLHSEAESDGFTMDFSPPIVRSAWIGRDAMEEKYHTDNSSLSVRWLPFSDPESGLLSYEVCVGTPSSECSVKDFFNVGLNTNFTIKGLNLMNGKYYQVTVRGTNHVGQTAETTTKPVLVDITAPEVVDPIDNLNITNVGASNDSDASPYVRFSCTEELLSVDWDEYEDPESGLSEYKWCVGKRRGSCDVISLRSVELKSSAQAITERAASGTQLFAKVDIINKGGLVASLSSKQCVVITAVPRVLNVIDLDSINSTNTTDIDWKASMESLTLKWQLLGNFLSDITRMKLEVAVTQPSLKDSYPKLDVSKSWNGELFAQDFMAVPPLERSVTVRSLDLQPWEEYRGVVRVWNEGQIYAEGSTDSIRLEPRAPLPRKLILRDNAPERERKRWLPQLRLPPVNESLIDQEVKYISSPADISVDVTTGLNMTNSTLMNETLTLLDEGKFSPTKEFKLLAIRVTSIDNSTNTTEDTEVMKMLPGIANPEGPCCLNHTMDSHTRYTDTHFKPTIPVQKFGSSVVFLSNGYVTAGAFGKAFVFSTKKSSNHHEMIEMKDSKGSESNIKVLASGDKVAFMTNGVIQIHKYTFTVEGSIRLQKQSTISNCETQPCTADITWSKLVGMETAISNDTLVARGRLPTTNQSIVGIFREANGAWRIDREVGQPEQDESFGDSIAVNAKIIAVTLDNGKFVKLYSTTDLSVIAKIDLSRFSANMSSPSLRLTDTDTLVAVSKEGRLVLVLDINVITKSYSKVCQYSPPPEVSLSGHADFTRLNDGTLLALGMQMLSGRDGVLLLGFHGAYQYHPDPSRAGTCVQLARLDSRENHFRVDDGIPRAAVAVQDSKIIFGTPGVLTLPGQSERRGTGRVYMSTFCPRNFVRTRVEGVGLLDTLTCEPCEHGRQSFGGYSSMCTSCKGRRCASSDDDDPIHFSTDICDNDTCPYSEEYDNTTGGVKVLQENGTFFAEGGSNEFTLQLIETTRADMSTTSMSESFIIDTTPPEIGVIYDGLGGERSVNCSVNKTFGGEGEGHCSTSDFEETDVDFTNNTSEVHARWVDFQDKESDIVEYFWCLGSQPLSDDIRECESTGMRPNGSHFGLDFQQGDKYYVTVVACNSARRCSAASSNGVTIDTTPPVMHYVRDGVLGPDIDYQVFVDIIFAYFKGSDAESGIASYEVAWGTAPNLTDVHNYEEVGNITTWFAKFKDNALKRNHRYYAMVRATNKAGLSSEPMSSNGVVVGKSEYVFDKNASASFFFDTVNMNVNGTRKDKGVGKTYGTLDVPEGAVKDEVKLRCYSLDKKNLETNKSDDGPVSNPKVTRPKQFMMGNYSFQIKAVNPYNNTPQEGYKFVKPIKISMFYDVDNLVNANKRVVNKEVQKDDIDPVLYLWDPKNSTWMDASLTCPEPWYHVNRSIKLLTVNICHLTQFAFFWSFKAQKGLMMFEKNNTVYNDQGEIEINRTRSEQQIHLPIKRSKGAMGKIEVTWSLYNNRSSDTKLIIWPTSGILRFNESQWNATLTLNIASDDVETKERVIWVTLDNTTGGAILASRDMTSSKITIASNFEESYTMWIVIGVCLGVILVLLIALLIWGLKRRDKNKKMTDRRLSKRASKKITDEIPMGSSEANLVQSEIRPSPMIYRLAHDDDARDSESDSAMEDDAPGVQVKQPSKKKKPMFSFKRKSEAVHPTRFDNPIYGTVGIQADERGQVKEFENPVYGEIMEDPTFSLRDYDSPDGEGAMGGHGASVSAAEWIDDSSCGEKVIDSESSTGDDEVPEEERYVEIHPFRKRPATKVGGDELETFIGDATQPQETHDVEMTFGFPKLESADTGNANGSADVEGESETGI